MFIVARRLCCTYGQRSPSLPTVSRPVVAAFVSMSSVRTSRYLKIRPRQPVITVRRRAGKRETICHTWCIACSVIFSNSFTERNGSVCSASCSYARHTFSQAEIPAPPPHLIQGCRPRRTQLIQPSRVRVIVRLFLPCHDSPLRTSTQRELGRSRRR